MYCESGKQNNNFLFTLIIIHLGLIPNTNEKYTNKMIDPEWAQVGHSPLGPNGF